MRGLSVCNRGDCARGIVDLDGRSERRQRQFEHRVAGHPDPAAVADQRLEITARAQQARTDPLRLIQQTARRIDAADDAGPIRAENAGLLAADGVDVVAEPVLVVQIDGRHDRRVRIDDVHRIEPAAESDFENRDVEFTLRKNPQCGQRAELEVGERDVAARGFDALEGIDQCSVVDVAAQHANALVVAQQMRRGERAGAQVLRAKHRFEKRDRRTFAVGAADGDDEVRAICGASMRCQTARTRSSPSSMSRGWTRCW